MLKKRACKVCTRITSTLLRLTLKSAFANFCADVRNGRLTTFFARTSPEIFASACPSYMTWSFCNFPWRERFRVSPARSPPAQTVLTQHHNAVPFRLPARRAVVPVRPSRLQKMSMTFLDEMRTCSSPGGSLREHTATQGFTLIPTFLDGSHTVRAVEGGPCVPPLPPQVPRMAAIDVSVATASFLICFESLEVRGPPI